MLIFQVTKNQSFGGSLDLNELLIKHPAATFFVRVEGDSNDEVGIHSGDILVVDRALKPLSEKVVLAIVDGEFVLKKCIATEKGLSFVSIASKNKKDKLVMDIQIWGVVTFVIKSLG